MLQANKLESLLKKKQKKNNIHIQRFVNEIRKNRQALGNGMVKKSLECQVT